MKNLILITAILFLVGCGGDLSFNDGTWSMCTFKNKDGLTFTVPVQTNLPVGAEHPNGTVVKCEPIPAQ